MSNHPPSIRRIPSAQAIGAAACLVLFPTLLGLTGCTGDPPPAAASRVWSRQGVGPGDVVKPRAVQTGTGGELFVVDMTGRIQVFSDRGQFLRQWRTPEVRNGKPCGLGWSSDGLLMVADTHYFRILFYQPDGTLVEERTIGGRNGRGPGEFGFVTDVVQDREGNYYVSEYGDNDRIQKFGPDGEFVTQWGSHGDGPGQFLRPQSLVLDDSGMLWVADACNHRIQVFSVSGDSPALVRMWGTAGQEPGQLRYPYGLLLDREGSVVVCEFGNHRIQKFTPEGKPLGLLGGPGREPGQFRQPWSIALDSQGDLVVVDSYNHRIQQIPWGQSGSPD